jgi:V/A-type H+-transporting ATPase subunit F
MKYFVIGDEDVLLGFQMVGVRGAVVRNTNDALSAFNEALQDKNIGVILITESVANSIRKNVDNYIFTHDFPLICEIPGRAGRDKSRPSLKSLANDAIGIKL